MTHPNSSDWLSQCRRMVDGYRNMIDASVSQLDDDEMGRRPAEGFNSVAVLLRHLGGNLQSRWTDFLSTDGEKEFRDRDAEFEDWPGSRDELMTYFDSGWRKLVEELDSLSGEQLDASVTIRGERHSVPQAILRSLTHVAYHAGQIVFVARLVKSDSEEWKWLTVEPGQSKKFNADTWGTSASRSILK